MKISNIESAGLDRRMQEGEIDVAFTTNGYVPEGLLSIPLLLPRHVDSVAVFEAAKAAHVGAVPGAVFSTTRRYDHCIRLQCGEPWSSAIEAGVRTLGAIIAREADRPH